MTETLYCINDYYNDKYKVAKDLSHDMFVIVDYGYYFNQGVVCDKFTDTGVNMKELLLYLCASLFLTLLSLMLVFIIKI